MNSMLARSSSHYAFPQNTEYAFASTSPQQQPPRRHTPPTDSNDPHASLKKWGWRALKISAGLVALFILYKAGKQAFGKTPPSLPTHNFHKPGHNVSLVSGNTSTTFSHWVNVGVKHKYSGAYGTNTRPIRAHIPKRALSITKQAQRTLLGNYQSK